MRVAPTKAAAAALAVLIAAGSLPAGHPVKAQSQGASSATRPARVARRPNYRMRLTPQRALALVHAARFDLDYVPGEVLIRFRAGVSAAGQQRALQGLRSRPPVNALRWIGNVALLRDGTERDAHRLAAALRRQPEVLYAEPNYILRKSAEPTDPGFVDQWNMRALDMPRAWDINPGATDDIIVAVIDTGVTTVDDAFVFPTFTGEIIEDIDVPFAVSPDLTASRFVDAIDLVFWEGPVLDMEGHGTHVASTIGEDSNNDVGYAGIAYNVKLMPVKACLSYWDVQFVLAAFGFEEFAPLDSGGCPLDAVIEAIRYAADQGAKVINLSLGAPQVTPLEQEALNYAVGKGVFITAAAGNNFEEGNQVEFPAGYAPGIDGLMSVGAVGPSLARSFYSSTGAHVEIAAPGGNSREGGADGTIWQVSLLFDDYDPETVIEPRFDRYVGVPNQGTSMAAPHVAGLAALLISQGVDRPAAIEAIIKASALDLGPADRDNEFGFGLIQPPAALRGLGVAR